MVSLRQIKEDEKGRAKEQQLIRDLNAISSDIDRCERTLTALTNDLAAVNTKYQGPRTTRQDVEYLTGLLDCAKRKLAWEKQLAGIQKRTPAVLERMALLIGNSPEPAAEPRRLELLQALQRVQAAMERLQKATPQ